jgi:hypothetical protein
MAISAKVDNYGLQDALKKMQKLDPAMRRTLLKDTKVAAKPLVDAINARVPQAPPLSGMAHNGRTGWSKVKKVQISLNTRKPRKGSITAGAEQIAVVPRCPPKAHLSPSQTWQAKLEEQARAENPNIADPILRAH